MLGVIHRGLQKGLQTTWTLGKVIFPVTIIVTILQYTPILPWVIQLLTPVMGLIGLPGEAAVALVLGNAVNLFAGIGAIVSFEFTVKEVFMMAVMLSFSHNLIIESAVASKVGVSGLLLSGIRVALALFAGVVINIVWQGGSEAAQYGLISATHHELTSWNEIILHGIQTALIAVMQLAMIIILLMIVLQYFREKGWLSVWSSKMAPFAKMLGMKKNTSMILVAGLTVGLAFGAGLMIEAVKEDHVSKKDTMLALIFLVACHAVIEDTLIFIPLGIPVWPLLVIRVVTAIILTMSVAFVWNKVAAKERKMVIEHTNRSIRSGWNTNRYK